MQSNTVLDKIRDLYTKSYTYFMVDAYFPKEVPLMQAQEIWSQNQRIYFYPYYRISGDPRVIKWYFKSQGFKNAMIKELLTSERITYTNYTSKKAYYKERTTYLAWKRELLLKDVKSKGTAGLDKFLAPEKKREVRKTTQKAEKNIQLFKKKYKDLIGDKALNVSNIKDDGSGARVSKMAVTPKTLQYPPGTSIKLVSNNLESYLLALELLDLSNTAKREIRYMEKLQEKGIIKIH